MTNEKDPHTIRASMVLAAIEELGSRQKIMAEVLGSHTEKIDGITEMVGKNTEDIDDIKIELKRHRKILNEHTQTHNEHGKILKVHSKLLGEHGKLLGEHGRDLKEIKSNYARRSDLAPLEHRVTALERKTA